MMARAMAERVSGNEARGVMLTQMGLALMASRWSGARDILVTVGDASGGGFQPSLKIATGQPVPEVHFGITRR